MNFKKATDELFAGVHADDLAKALRISVQTIKQARADEQSTAYRSPPPGWERAVARLAKARATRLIRLADKLE